MSIMAQQPDDYLPSPTSANLKPPQFARFRLANLDPTAQEEQNEAIRKQQAMRAAWKEQLDEKAAYQREKENVKYRRHDDATVGPPKYYQERQRQQQQWDQQQGGGGYEPQQQEGHSYTYSPHGDRVGAALQPGAPPSGPQVVTHEPAPRSRSPPPDREEESIYAAAGGPPPSHQPPPQAGRQSWDSHGSGGGYEAPQHRRQEPDHDRRGSHEPARRQEPSGYDRGGGYDAPRQGHPAPDAYDRHDDRHDDRRDQRDGDGRTPTVEKVEASQDYGEIVEVRTATAPKLSATTRAHRPRARGVVRW